jgi:hypothetical protein
MLLPLDIIFILLFLVLIVVPYALGSLVAYHTTWLVIGVAAAFLLIRIMRRKG